jgi:hypothetical protein
MRIAGVVLIAAALVSASAWAAPSAKQQKEAASLLKEAQALRKKNDVAAALEKYRAAHEILYAPATGLEVGRAYLELGRLVDAREAFLAIARIDVGPKESAADKKAREEAEKLADELATRIPSITIHVERIPPDSTLVVTIDDDVLAKVALALPRKVDPGKHRVVATVSGTTYTQTYDVVVAEGENKTIDIVLGPPPKVELPPPPPPPPPSISRPTSPLVYIGFATAGAGLVVGGVSAILAMNSVARLRDECVDGRCPPPVHDDLSAARTASTISTISFVVAGVGVGLGVYGLMSERKATTTAARVVVQPTLGFGMVGLSGAF